MSDDSIQAGALTLALDVGGTFTDVILAKNDGHGFWVTKSSSVPSDPALGFFNSVDKVLELSSLSAAQIGLVLHGSTVATNAILERKTAKTGLITTAGFQHALEIGRADIPRKANLYSWVKPKRPVPPRFVYEVRERVNVDGSVDVPLDEQALEEVAGNIRRDGLDTVAIVFLHSYLHPAHEERAGELLRQYLPDISISLSSEILPVFREFERAMATVMNAGVRPVVGPYIEKLDAGLNDREIAAPLYIMKSNGGICSPREAARQPIHLALSGPSAGAKSAAHIGSGAGFENIVTIDMGGTSADVALIRDGVPATTSNGQVGEFPLTLPIIDIHTIGAGGGSIAHVGANGALNVGPESAGANPGPAAYGQGGTLATVTDANLVLGRVPPRLLDGEVALDECAARQAIQDNVAGPLGLSAEAAARAIVEIVDNNMVGALKVMSIERGLDPRDFALCAFGGAGPVHGARLMRLLGAPRLLVPRFPGIMCAIGLLGTDFKYEFAVTRLLRAPNYDFALIEDTYANLMQQAEAKLAGDGIAAVRQVFEKAADLRYAQQGVELTIKLPVDRLTPETIDRLTAAFHTRHEELYTFSDPAAPVEIVNLRVIATGVADTVSLPEIERASPGHAAVPYCQRKAALDGEVAVDVPVYRREDLLCGHTIDGPGIVDQLDATTGILPQQRAGVDLYGNLIIEDAA